MAFKPGQAGQPGSPALEEALVERARRAADTEPHPGPPARIAIASSLLMFSMMGFGFYGLPVYVATLGNDPAVGSAVAASAATVYALISGLVGSLVGWLMRRLPLPVVLIGGGMLGAVCLVLLGQSGARFGVLLAMAGLGAGTSVAGLVPATTLIVRAYGSRAARPTVLVTTAIPVSGMAVPPLADALIGAHDLTGATWILGGAYLSMVCAAAALLQGRAAATPEPIDPSPAAARNGAAPPQRPDFRVVVWLACCVTAIFLVQNSLLTHIVALGLDRGVGNPAAALTVVSAVSLGARLLSLRVIDGVAIHRFAAVVAATQALATAILGLTTSSFGYYAGAAVFGFAVANAITVVPLLVTAVTPARHYASVYSVVWSSSLILSAFGPLAVEAVRGSTSGYPAALIVLALIATLATAALLFGGRWTRGLASSAKAFRPAARQPSTHCGSGDDVDVASVMERSRRGRRQLGGRRSSSKGGGHRAVIKLSPPATPAPLLPPNSLVTPDHHRISGHADP